MRGPARSASGAALALVLLAGAGGAAVAGPPGPGSAATEGLVLRAQSVQGDQEAAYCPQVLVIDGRSAIRHGASQVSISQIARECIEKPDGSVVVKVGVEGLALLGAGGGGGRFNVPVLFQIRQGDKVIVSRTRQASVAVGGGESQGSFTTVEGGMVVPPRSGPFDIEVGLGGGGGRGGRRR